MTSERGRLYRLTGSDDVTTGVPERYLTKPNPTSILPDADELCEAQIGDAIRRIHDDTSEYPRFPWRTLDDLTGPMCPGNLIIAAARTGQGKSLFLQNLFGSLIRDGRHGLYIGLEQTPDDLRTKWACLDCDVPPKLVLAPGRGEQGQPHWNVAMHDVQEHYKWQKTPDIKRRAHFAATRKINAAGLALWTKWAVDRDCQFVIVDHVDRIDHGEGKNSFHEVSETIRLAKELAVREQIIMILASQVGRPSDALEQFMPISLHNLRGGGTKEEEADTVLGIYRPLKATIAAKDLTEVRQGTKAREDVIEPNIMGVMLLKHRIDGPMAGKFTKLGVRHQRVFEIPEKDRHTTVYGGRDV